MTVLLRKFEILELLKISEATLERWVRSGEFPSPFTISGRSVFWISEEIDEFINASAAGYEISELKKLVKRQVKARPDLGL